MAEYSERRGSERFAVGADTSCSFISPVVTNFGGARIKDLSMDGIGLMVSRRVEVGTMLAVSITSASRGYTKTVIVRVAHCTSLQNGFLVGGTFQTPLTYQELTSLVMQMPSAGEPWKVRT